MCTARGMQVSLAVAFWSVYMGVVPPASGANLTGCFQMAAEVTDHNRLRTVYVYDDHGHLIDIQREILSRPDPNRSQFRGRGFIAQCDSDVEGTISRDVPCGEEPNVKFMGTVSEDNRVELITTIPGRRELCTHDAVSCYHSQTDWAGLFEGVYDPNKRVISGTFEAYQEQDNEECWGEGWHWLEGITDAVTKGTFTITIGCFGPEELVKPFAGLECGCPMVQGIVDSNIYSADSGERLELLCIGGECPDRRPHFELRYYQSKCDKEGFCIARCWFPGGANRIWCTGPDVNGNDVPDCFHYIVLQNRDCGFPDCPNLAERLVCIEHRYDAHKDRLTIYGELLEYPEGCALPVRIYYENDVAFVQCTCPSDRTCTWKLSDFKRDGDPYPLIVSKPLGEDTENFFKQSYRDVCSLMDPNKRLPCQIVGDLDWDGDCDEEDFQIASLALGTSRGQQGYSSLADVDGDGCVTQSDIDFLFDLPESSPPANGAINPVDGAILRVYSRGAQGDWRGVGYSCVPPHRDSLNVMALANRWLEESP